MTMTITNDIKEVVTVHFKMDDGVDVFPGALVLTKAEYDALSPEDLVTLQTTKYNEWIAARTPPTEAQLTVQKEQRLENIPTEIQRLQQEEVVLKSDLGIE